MTPWENRGALCEVPSEYAANYLQKDLNTNEPIKTLGPTTDSIIYVHYVNLNNKIKISHCEKISKLL